VCAPHILNERRIADQPLLPCLADLEPQTFFGIFDAFAFIHIRRPQGPDIRRNLTDQMFVDPLKGQLRLLLVDLRGYPSGRLKSMGWE
jgi:hypothetical protein